MEEGRPVMCILVVLSIFSAGNKAVQLGNLLAPKRDDTRESLECYTCDYYEREGDDGRNPSCKTGEHPVKRYLRQCETWDGSMPERMIASRGLRRPNVSIAQEEEEPPLPTTTPEPRIHYCLKLDFDGSFFSTNESMSGTMRQCFWFTISYAVRSECLRMTIREWEDRAADESLEIKDIYWARMLAYNVFAYFSYETVVSSCLCVENQCNAAVRSYLGLNVATWMWIWLVYLVLGSKNEPVVHG